MELIFDEAVLDFKKFLGYSSEDNYGGSRIGYFLDRYHNLLFNLEQSIITRENKTICRAVSEIRSFTEKNGGTRISSILSEYEKHSSIGDYVKAGKFESFIFEELNLFKETVISSFC